MNLIFFFDISRYNNKYQYEILSTKISSETFVWRKGRHIVILWSVLAVDRTCKKMNCNPLFGLFCLIWKGIRLINIALRPKNSC